MEKFHRKVVTNCLLLKRIKTEENALANLVTTLMIRMADARGYHADFSIINHGIFRSTWYPGVIEDQHFMSMFPFDDFFAAFEISGADLK